MILIYVFFFFGGGEEKEVVRVFVVMSDLNLKLLMTHSMVWDGSQPHSVMLIMTLLSL